MFGSLYFAGECPLDPGGYFVVKGTEKVSPQLHLYIVHPNQNLDVVFFFPVENLANLSVVLICR